MDNPSERLFISFLYGDIDNEEIQFVYSTGIYSYNHTPFNSMYCVL